MDSLRARALAAELLDCSPCVVQMAAVLWDEEGIISVGWNRGDGDCGGIHAERDAVERADEARLFGVRLTIAGRRRKSKNWVFSRPCDGNKHYRGRHDSSCLDLLASCGIGVIEYVTKSGNWEEMRLQFVRVR